MSATDQTFYITTTLPYVNAEPHLGFAMELIRADTVARYRRLLGDEVFFNTGTDEHGAKIYEKAAARGVAVQDLVDQVSAQFRELTTTLNVLPDIHFLRTTDEHHCRAAQEFWRRCEQDIYKGRYQVKYCVGCELEKTESDLNSAGRCPEHPDRELEIREEENYFFRFSAYADQLLELYQSTPDFVRPAHRQEEIRKFVERGLEDFSISRLKTKMSWGIPVPDDPEHVMYVWFDALVNYVSTLGWPQSAKAPLGTAEEEGDFEKYWVNGTPTQYAGKDNLRQQAAMWQAMLLSAGLPPSRRVIINGFIVGEDGQKMSKSLGNVISPRQLVEEYGVEVLRYFLIREISPFEDSPVSLERFREAYQANLANGLGNVVSRITKMAETHLSAAPAIPANTIPAAFHEAMNDFDLQAAAEVIWERIAQLDIRIAETEPFKLVKTDPAKAKEIIQELAVDLYTVGRMLDPIMPETSAVIKEAVKSNAKPAALFPRR